MPARATFRRCITRVALLLMLAISCAVSAANEATSPGAQREHLQLPLDANEWRITFEDDGDSATWRYRPVPALNVSFDEITVTALDLALAPFPAREMPQRTHALLASHAPGLVLDVHSSATPDRVVYVLSTGKPDDTTILGLAQDGATALHTVEVELKAGTAQADVERWADVLDRATLVPARSTVAD